MKTVIILSPRAEATTHPFDVILTSRVEELFCHVIIVTFPHFDDSGQEHKYVEIFLKTDSLEFNLRNRFGFV